MSSVVHRIAASMTATVLALAPATAIAQDEVVAWPTDGWTTSTPEEQGMDSAILADGLEYLLDQNGFDIHSLTVIRNGHIVTDARFYPFEGGLHDIASATKSVTSMLVGIAIEQGLIEDVDQPVLEFFLDRTVANVDADKEAMTVEDLLTMSPGFECTHNPNDFTTQQVMATPDWVQATLDLPMTHAPGTRWVYCSPASHLLSALVADTSGMSTEEYAQRHLFAPLGIAESMWLPDPQGYNQGWGYLFLDPRDMAKLGYLYLNEGEWDGQRLLPVDYVAAATTRAVSPVYGYQWWLDPLRSGFYADGAHGQRIFVFPDEELLVITTGGGGSDYAVIGKLLNSYILPAIQADEPLPANSDGLALLEARVKEATIPPLAESLPSLPDRALDVSGRTIVLDGNPIGLETMTLTFGEGEAEALLGVGFQGGMGLEWAIGLDGVPRISPGLHGLPLAATGAWESDDVFVVSLDHLGNRDKERLRAAFSEDKVDLSGLDVPLVGHLESD